jgi:hypothetical protein
MPLNHKDAEARIAREVRGRRSEDWLVGIVVKFPDEGRIVRFGRADAERESATVIILPVIRIEHYADPAAESAEPQTPPPATNGGRRRVRRR